jgi:hypothetical protein
MNNFRPEYRRLFLLKNLPNQIKANDDHLQITDNYLENTSVKLRKFRQPKTKTTSYIFQQTHIIQDFNKFQTTEIFLDEIEYKIFETNLNNAEIRFNRYFFENVEIDVYLGNELRGLILATARFADEKTMQMFEKPNFAVAEVSNNPNFIGNNLLTKTFAELCQEIK